MQAIIVGSIFAALAVWLIVSHVKRKRRPVQDGIDYVVSSLNTPRQDNMSEVVLNQALPLSDHMVKDVATSRGYRFVSETSRYSNDTLLFAPRRRKRTRMAPHD